MLEASLVGVPANADALAKGPDSRPADELIRRGYQEHFRVVDGRLQAIGTGQSFEPKDIVIRGYYRFEGMSDSDDMSIVYAIESRDGTRGTLIDAFGVYSDPLVGDFVEAVTRTRAEDVSPGCYSPASL